MKKITSLLLALLLLLSIAGCGQTPETVVTVPPTVAQTQAAEQIIIPDLVGQDMEELPESGEYTVSVSHEMTAAGYFNGEIISQAPVGGSEADIGSVIYVIVNVGGPEKEDMTEPETTPPAVTEPQYVRPDLPEQTDPPRPTWDYPEDLPEQTDPPETLPPQTDPPETEPPSQQLDPNGTYTTKEDVALFIYTYHRLPNNFITKDQAEDRYGWDGGSLSRYGMCIGGDRFYNNEGLLPQNTYYECDIDTLYSSKRGSKRLVFTYSGIVYYTSDHYHSFQRLY